MSHNILTSKIRSDNVLVKLNCSSQDEVIGRLADRLQEQGIVKDSFRDAVIARENVYATGLDTGNICVAIPHTDRQHVLHDGIAVATLENPVAFVAMGTEDSILKVQVIFMLAISSDDKQIDTLQAIMGLVQHQSLLEKMIEVESSSELLNIISNYCD
ncbi:PTS sugar transporter subunit IIA [Vibrio sp. DW001]|uniref:PTS sugar transporter subunit IIA n=1 Tax=Vibrio sp. DW001 TaxID=2912315 RepID=UPI0023B07CC2|nr:PTS sugar transporter subunit IIA [Vibrio sp. DW001]WED27740.1 PTS sugar transporter subunit IIA [Vibrio sp. DW001]